MARLIAPGNSRRRKVGAVVNVDDSRVDALLRHGFTEPKSAAKKASSSKSKK